MARKALRTPFSLIIEAQALRGRIVARGFKAEDGLSWVRRDARLQWHEPSQLWVVDLFNISDAHNPEIATRRSHSDLAKLLKAFI